MQQRIKRSFKICYCHCPTLFHFFSLEVSIFTPFANYVCHVPEFFFVCVSGWPQKAVLLKLILYSSLLQDLQKPT